MRSKRVLLLPTSEVDVYFAVTTATTMRTLETVFRSTTAQAGARPPPPPSVVVQPAPVASTPAVRPPAALNFYRPAPVPATRPASVILQPAPAAAAPGVVVAVRPRLSLQAQADLLLQHMQALSAPLAAPSTPSALEVAPSPPAAAPIQARAASVPTSPDAEHAERSGRALRATAEADFGIHLTESPLPRTVSMPLLEQDDPPAYEALTPRTPPAYRFYASFSSFGDGATQLGPTLSVVPDAPAPPTIDQVRESKERAYCALSRVNELLAGHSNVVGVFVGRPQRRWSRFAPRERDDPRALIITVRKKGFLPPGETEFPARFLGARVDIRQALPPATEQYRRAFTHINELLEGHGNVYFAFSGMATDKRGYVSSEAIVVVVHNKGTIPPRETAFPRFWKSSAHDFEVRVDVIDRRSSHLRLALSHVRSVNGVDNPPN